MAEPLSSRQEILARLCAGNQTVTTLAQQLGISATAVRKTLTQLEADALVRYQVVRRGVGKPAHEYSITSEGEQQLSRAYLPLLQAVLRQLAHDLPRAKLEQVLRAAGTQLGVRNQVQGGTLLKRVQHAADILRSFGAAIDVRRRGGNYRLDCSCCAIAGVVSEQPLGCKAMESLLSDVIGTRVQERCDRTARPQCHFEVVP